MKLRLYPVNFIHTTDKRSVKAKNNILVSLLIKVCSIIISLLLVPITLNYLSALEYGVWLTLSSIMIWINYFDIGLGNGLRNKLAEALALGDVQKAQIYVSTTFFFLGILLVGVYLLFWFCNNWLNWYTILNLSSSDFSYNLNDLVAVVFAFFCLSFLFKTVGIIYLAKQLPVINDLLTFLGSLLSLIIIYVLTLTTDGNLEKVAIVFSGVPVFVYLLAYPFTFWRKYKELRPVFSAVKLKYIHDLMGVGGQFFIIQIACLLIFTTSNILITQLFGPEEVTAYNIAFKYFSVITMGFTIIINPFWSAATDAYVKGDYKWIHSSVKAMIKVWGILSLATILMIMASNWVYRLWVGESISISFFLSVMTGIYVSIVNWNNLFCYFINGIGKVRVQMYCYIVGGIFFIPIAILLGKCMGVAGIMLAMSLVLLILSVFLPLQYRKLIFRKASGIWNK